MITQEQRDRAAARIAAKEFAHKVIVSNMAHEVPDKVFDSLNDSQLHIFRQYLLEYRLYMRPDGYWEEQRN
jgi:hypothetical protein